MSKRDVEAVFSVKAEEGAEEGIQIRSLYRCRVHTPCVEMNKHSNVKWLYKVLN
jgi:hypothetical protein